MDDGVASALFALAVGFPIIAMFLLFGLVSGALFAGVLVGGLAAMFLAVDWLDFDDGENEPEADALHVLRERYVRGELSESEFERQVETLLETETTVAARQQVDDGVSGALAGELEQKPQQETDRERKLER